MNAHQVGSFLKSELNKAHSTTCLHRCLDYVIESNVKVWFLKMIESEDVVVLGLKDKVLLENNEWVDLSDRLRIEGVVIESGDTAIVRCFGNKRIVVDVKKNHEETVNGVGDLDTQIKQFSRLQGGY